MTNKAILLSLILCATFNNSFGANMCINKATLVAQLKADSELRELAKFAAATADKDAALPPCSRILPPCSALPPCSGSETPTSRHYASPASRLAFSPLPPQFLRLHLAPKGFIPISTLPDNTNKTFATEFDTRSESPGLSSKDIEVIEMAAFAANTYNGANRYEGFFYKAQALPPCS